MKNGLSVIKFSKAFLKCPRLVLAAFLLGAVSLVLCSYYLRWRGITGVAGAPEGYW